MIVISILNSLSFNLCKLTTFAYSFKVDNNKSRLIDFGVLDDIKRFVLCGKDLLIYFLLTTIKAHTTKTPREVIDIWLAPKPKPIAIERKVNESSSGSLIAVLNLTIDKAPTKPRDNAKEDLTIVITINVVIQITGKLFAKERLLDNVVPYFIYMKLIMLERIIAKAIFNRKSVIDILLLE